MSKEKKMASLKSTLMDAKNLKMFFQIVGGVIVIVSIASGALIGYVADSFTKVLMIGSAIGGLGLACTAVEVNKIDSKIEDICNQIKAVKLEEDDEIDEIKEDMVTNDLVYDNIKRMEKSISDEQDFENKFAYKHNPNEIRENNYYENTNKRR